ncbi:pirin family protein [Edaphobacter aggregans]|uniref:pirin family protein n=1 Tax=Edaphobacter aggregans TaxID=570835 RepID=UPI000557C42E|nr:pirin family protein [Edaphobacter aggregans]
MITVRKANERGHANHGWLDSYHTFSFANYHDPKHMGFRSLRVINEDRIAPDRGFGAHAHRDMEILSYVLRGKLAHKDSMGHTEVLGPNEIQRMSAGNGVVHSEFNGSDSEPVHFLQIWIQPRSTGIQPSYEQLKFEAEEKKNRFKILASPEREPGAALINQDARVSVAEIEPGHKLTYGLKDGRHAWVHVIDGSIVLNGTSLSTGDAVAVSDEALLEIEGSETGNSEVLVFDLA